MIAAATIRRTRTLMACLVLALGFGAAAGAQTIDWPSERPPRPLPARSVKFPPYEVQTLGNGLKVIAVLHHEQPVVSMRLLIKAGSSLDPKDKLGLVHMVASLLDQGTTTKTAQQMADQIDSIGGMMGAGAGTDLSFINMVVMKDSFDVGMAMLNDMARNPAFAPAELDRQRQQILSGLQVSLQDPGYVADAVFDRLVYGFHPYGLPQTGTPETIAAITQKDLVAFHDRYFAPNNAILAVVGDVTADEAFAEAKKVFGDWERKDVDARRFIDPPEATRRVVVVNKPDAVQTEVRVGHIGVPRTSPDYMALNLAIRILGGEGSNRLHQVLRTERGLTYGAEADMDTLKESGDFEAQTNTRSAATGEVVRLIVDEFWRLQRERVGDQELEGAKAYMTGSFPLTIETPDQIALQVLNNIFYDLPLEQLQNFRERVNAVTPDDIQRVAKFYLKPDRLSVVLVGNAAAFATQLKGVGFGNYETIELGDLDLTAANFKRDPNRAGQGRGEARGAPALRGGTPARMSYVPDAQQSTVASSDARSRTLLDRVVAAKGGLETLQSIKTITAMTSNDVKLPAGAQQTESTTYLQYPDRFRVEVKLPAGEMIQAFDGTHAWMQDRAGVHDAPEPVAREFRASLKRDLVALLVGAEAGSIRARALPDVKDDDGRVLHALELSGSGFEPTVLSIDPDSSLIAKQTYVASGPGQPLIEEIFSDYQPVDGVQIAHTARVRRGGKDVMMTRRITGIKINAPIDPTLFTRPSS